MALGRWERKNGGPGDVAQATTISLQSGATLDFVDPRSSNFTIEDVAHGLANLCRYSGQCRRFYSVAEHSLYVSELSEDFKLAALLHDAAEAFVADLPSPLKSLLPEYKRIENRIQRVIFDRFGLGKDIPPEVKATEKRMLAAEQAQIMPPGTTAWAEQEGIKPALILVRHLSPTEAKKLFLSRFEELK